jgi:hypothetical protein
MREREREDSPPQDKSVKALTPVAKPSELNLQAPNVMNPVAKEREQSLARELNLRAPEEERAQALVPEINLRTEDKILPSQAGTEPLRWTTMSANKEETIVINPLALHAPTTTLEPGPKNQARLDAIKRSRIDGTYAPSDGRVEWQRLNPFKNASEWIIWRNNQKAEARVAKDREMKLHSVETRPFNYARLKEGEASQLHVISVEGKGDDNSAGIAQEEGDEQVESGNEHFSPSSSEDNLGDDLDRLLNSSSAVPFLNDTTENQEQREDELVDYNEDDDEDDIRRNEEDKTTQAKIYADHHTEVEAHDLAVAERDDKSGDENIAQGASQEDETQDDTRQLAEMRLINPVVKPVLTQKGLMDIIAK